MLLALPAMAEADAMFTVNAVGWKASCRLENQGMTSAIFAKATSGVS